MSNPLFSTYSQGENRVTSTLLAVFERLSFAIVEQILQAVLEEPETTLVSFQNQPSGPKSVPDARIFASFSYWIETKTARDAVRLSQVRNHLQALDHASYGPAETKRLLVLTPDPHMPVDLEVIEDDRLVWSNFENLVTAIQDTIQVDEDWLSSAAPLPTEGERELLRELVQFLAQEGLVGETHDRVLVVAARKAYPEYLRYGLYFCQPNRSFRRSLHMGFYYEGQVQAEFPEIQGSIESIQIEEETVRSEEDLTEEQRQRLLDVIAQLEDEGNPRIGKQEKVLFLSERDAEETLKIERPIRNDLASESGRTIAFTQGQRYVTLEAVKEEPETTSELLRLADGA